MTDDNTGENTGANPALPDRLSTNPASPFHNPELLERGGGYARLWAAFSGQAELVA